VGTFRHPVEVGDPSGQRYERVEALVDTGATFSVFPASQLQSLGVTPFDRERLIIGDGSQIEVGLGRTWVRVNGKSELTIVVFGNESLVPLLGAYALEGLRLAVDPINKRLIPIQGLFPSLMDPTQFR